MTEGNDFWSRRKAAVKAEAKADRQAEELARQAGTQEQLEEKSDDEILAELKLPDPDALQAGDDFSAFMAKAVPDRLRRRALRRLWLTNPVLANLDELLEYGEDYTDAATVVENLQTAYQVGKGMLAHVEKMADDAARLETGEAGVEAGAEAGAEVSEDDAELDRVVAASDEETDDNTGMADASEETGSAVSGGAVKRRMQINFPTEAT
ncbi:MAG: DUF3306 domain-containing protein [Albidovulum sp.]|nr:DUF3306 domain-containing protein [Albidovulum sp.]MDE0533125.1 DUF3306 domain-containing protein [Albidovulum sp.]